MRCQTLIVLALGLTALTGCPHDLAKEEGFFDRAAAKDTRERILRPECTDQVRQELCPEGAPKSEECLKVCGT